LKTVLVPTHERQNYIERIVKYYGKYDVNLVIVDSSKNRCNTDFDGDKVTYLHLPKMSFYEKIIKACDEINDEFLVLAPDDDFIYYPSIQSSYEKMNTDKRISLCMGEFEFFHVRNVDHIYHRPSSFLNNNKLMSDSKRVQISHFMSNYSQVLWSAYRKDVFLKSMQLLKLACFENENFIEISIASTALSMGNIFYMNKYFGLREETDEEHWGSRHKSISLHDTRDLDKLHNLHYDEFGNDHSNLIIDGYFQFIKRRKTFSFRLYRYLRSNIENTVINRDNIRQAQEDALLVIKN